MDTKSLIEYKSNGASTVILEKAEAISLVNVVSTKNRYEFVYKGSESRPYIIEVKFYDGTINSNCTCRYNYGGLCKHEVAGIDYILEKNKNKTQDKDLFGNTISLKKENVIFLENHLLTDRIIETLSKKLQDKYYERYYEIKIISLELGKIITVYDKIYSHEEQQVFTYDKITNYLETSCTCGSKKVVCEHVVRALITIYDKYGGNIFSPNYLNNSIELFLEPYSMSINDNYEKYFDFSLGVNGAEVIEKVKNFVPNLSLVKDELIPEIKKKESLFILKRNPSVIDTHGLGFCFEFDTGGLKGFLSLIPFIAKFKKKTTEFASSFNEITEYNLMDYIKSWSNEEQLVVIKALAFKNANDYFSNEFNVEELKFSFLAFQDFIKATEKYLFFEKKSRKSLVKKNLKPLVFKNGKVRLFFTLIENGEFYTLKCKLSINNDKTYQIDSSSVKIYPYFVKIKEEVYLFDELHSFIYINKLQGRGEINFQKKDFDKLYSEIIAPLTEHFEIKTKVYKKSKKRINQSQLERQVYLSDFEGEFIVFKLVVQYNDKNILLHTKEQMFDEKTQQIIKRDESFENNFLEEFKELHPDFEQQDGLFFLTPNQLIENEWLLKASEKLKHKSIEVFGANDLKSFKFNLNKPTISISVSSDIDWFDLNIEVKFGKQKVSLNTIRKTLLNKSKYVQLDDGSIGILSEEWLKKFSKYFKIGEVKNDKIKISNFQFNIIDELYNELETTPKFLMDLQQKRIRLLNLETSIAVNVPKNIKATLRPYQKEGLNWLVFLDENNLGGCLADDMGLGKTLQVITFFSYLKSKKKVKNQHLVIMPTSLIFNWQKEIENFCPSLKVIVYTGNKRKMLVNDFSKFDVILTTYGSILNDIEVLKEIKFNYVILDESQAVKNPNSKRYKAVRLLQSENRLALTGTPIENNTFDLYAQMNFLNPGILGSMSNFRKEFSEAIDKKGDKDASSLLSNIIHPFLLRRTKEQVATELPEKTETVLYCEMGLEQRRVYEVVKEEYRDYLLNKIDEHGVEKSQMYVLQGLTKLRQICNSPELIKDDFNHGKASIKLDILIENIQNKITNHKILVFSQFTSMLGLIRERLKEYDVSYEYLDGKTKDREGIVKNFQENDDVRVFLISLKAGGVGLNLVAADYVFLVDPWWNPAVENQAIDRCYRIGQNKKVMAYKMICKDTIEEKITNLQNKKKQVSQSIIQVDKVEKSFNTEQIKELFS
tara:strand:+ start:22040 stop:25708 length:3669 start_codon:yes stop_codon:yes gene_type:complete